jgi:hypothetical protein
LTNFDSSNETAQGIPEETASPEVTPIETTQPSANEKSLEGEEVEQKVKSAQSQPAQAIEPCSTSCSTPSSTFRLTPEEDLLANVELIRDCIEAQSWGMITELTQKWTGEFKSLVWNFLTIQEREVVKQLKLLEDT